MVWLVGKCGCHDRSFSGILGPRLFLSPDNSRLLLVGKGIAIAERQPDPFPWPHHVGRQSLRGTNTGIFYLSMTSPFFPVSESKAFLYWICLSRTWTPPNKITPARGIHLLPFTISETPRFPEANSPLHRAGR